MKTKKNILGFSIIFLSIPTLFFPYFYPIHPMVGVNDKVRTIVEQHNGYTVFNYLLNHGVIFSVFAISLILHLVLKKKIQKISYIFGLMSAGVLVYLAGGYLISDVFKGSVGISTYAMSIIDQMGLGFYSLLLISLLFAVWVVCDALFDKNKKII